MTKPNLRMYIYESQKLINLYTTVGQVPREAVTPRNVPFPSMDCQQSESYKLDVSAGNTSMFIAYKHIYESFYVACAVTDLLARIWLVLPEPDRNMFRTVPNIRQLQTCPPEMKRPSVQDHQNHINYSY
jgi:hypothetical protein